MAYSERIPRPLDDLAELLEFLSHTAVEQIAETRKGLKQVRSNKGGESLHPGEQTPLWNAMVTALRPHLTQRGAKSNLARVLGLPRQRIYEYITRPTVLPDAETTLHLLLWLYNREDRLEKGPRGQPWPERLHRVCHVFRDKCIKGTALLLFNRL